MPIERPLSLRVCTPLIAILLLAAVLAGPTSAAADDATAQDVARLAGSFNGWNPTDAGMALQRSGQTESLTRWWPCGIHYFKFTFGGKWDKHWGDDGRNGLTQPGGNIRLSIPSSRYYTLSLDRGARQWTLLPAYPEKPKAVIVLHGAQAGQALITLDARHSALPKDKSIESCEWKVVAAEGGAELPVMTTREAGAAQARLRVPKSGTYTIRLTLKCDDVTDSTELSADLGGGYLLSAVRTTGDKEVEPQTMRLMASQRWGCVYRAESEGTVTFKVSPACAPNSTVATVTAACQAGKPLLVRYDAIARRVDTSDSGWNEFAYEPAAKDGQPAELVEAVELVGDFNEWQPGRHPLFELTGTDGGWRRIVELPDGRHAYKLLINGTRMVEDATADAKLRVADGAGGYNSVVRIGPDAATFGPAKPDHITVEALAHNSNRTDDFARVSRVMCDLRVRTLADDVMEVRVAVQGRAGGGASIRKTVTRNGFDYWTGRVSLPADKYVISLSDGTATHALHAQAGSGPAGEGPQDTTAMSFETPDWAKSAIWYQIFPERFCNGDRSNDPPRTVPWSHDWYKPYQPDKDKPDGSTAFTAGYAEKGETFYHYIYDRRYGGDIQGIQQKLPYLRELGVNALYLNPVFLAESLHKYDASDYRHIDDYFGVKDSLTRLKEDPLDPASWQWSESDRVFLAFVKEAHRQGFRVVLDGVFNHVGREFWAFQDVLRNKQNSRYADWFDIKSWEPFHYYGWWGEDNALPRLRHSDTLGLAEPVRQHIFAITRRWMAPDGDVSAGIDGWRLDVAPDINEHFWRDWRKLVKSINPQAYLSAEIWTEARHMLAGDQFDAVMNYEFAKSCQRFFVNRHKAIPPTQFDRELQNNLALYQPQVNLVMMNLFDSHDTDRIASMMLNPDHEYDAANRLQDTNPRYHAGRPTADCYQRVKLAVSFQMMYLGAPMIWYGNEVGMFGADDPTCRKPMLWPELLPYANADEVIMPDMLEHHIRMIAIRNTFPCIQLGSFATVLTDDNRGLIAFERRLDNDTVLVVVNNSDQALRGDIPAAWPAGSQVVRLDDPKSAEIVMPAEGRPAGRATIRAAKDGVLLTISKDKTVSLSIEPRTAAVIGNPPGRGK